MQIGTWTSSRLRANTACFSPVRSESHAPPNRVRFHICTEPYLNDNPPVVGGMPRRSRTLHRLAIAGQRQIRLTPCAWDAEIIHLSHPATLLHGASSWGDSRNRQSLRKRKRWKGRYPAYYYLARNLRSGSNPHRQWQRGGTRPSSTAGERMITIWAECCGGFRMVRL